MDNKNTKNKSSILRILLGSLVVLLVFVGCLGLLYSPQEASEEAASPCLSAEAFRSQFLALDYGDAVTYVIGHQTPDTDATMSAIAMAEFLNSIGIRAEARIAGKPNGEVTYLLDTFGIPTPEILTDADGTQLWLVDHSSYSNAVKNADKARIVGISDHHGIGDVTNTEMIFVSSGGYRSTTTLIASYFIAGNVEISKQTAQILLFGMLSDIPGADLAFDREIYDQILQLSEISDPELLQAQMKDAGSSYYGMTDLEVYLSDYKDYSVGDIRYGIGCITVKSPDQVEEYRVRMDNTLQQYVSDSGPNFALYMLTDQDFTIQYIGFCGKNMDSTTEVMEEALSDYGENHGIYFKIFGDGISRKGVVVPQINRALNLLTTSGDS